MCDNGKKRSSPPVFLKNWLNFCIQGQFEIKILIVQGHSDINIIIICCVYVTMALHY